MLMILLCTLSVIRHLICSNNQNWLLNLNLIYEIMWTGAGSSLLISMLEKLNQFCLISLITGVIDVKMDESAFEEKSSFKMLGFSFSHKLDWGSYMISIAKTAYIKIEALICSMKFLSPEVALYLYKPTIRPCMEYLSGLVLLVASWNCWIGYKNGYAGLFVLHLLLLLNPWPITEM